MHEMKHGYRASAALIRGVLEVASRAGVDPEEILQAVGLDSSTLENPQARISQEQHIGIWIEAINRTGDEDFGLHMGELLTPARERNILSYVMLNCSTAGEALEKLCLYHDLMAEGISIRLGKEGSFAYLSLEITPNLKINLPKYVLKAIHTTNIGSMRFANNISSSQLSRYMPSISQSSVVRNTTQKNQAIELAMRILAFLDREEILCFIVRFFLGNFLNMASNFRFSSAQS